VSTLLPANASITAEDPGPDVDAESAAGEPMLYRLRVEDPIKPISARFLHVLQGADGAAQSVPTTLVTSSAGTRFDGAVMNGVAVLFQNDITVPFAGVTYSVPAAVATQYVTGLAPGGTYTVALQPAGNMVQVTITPGGNQPADAGGVLVIGAGAGGPVPTFSIAGTVTSNDAGLAGATVSAGN